MSELPKLEFLAELVSKVTQTMFGMSFQLSGTQELPWKLEPPWRTALLPIPGKQPLTVAIAADQSSASTLGGAMFSCGQADVDASMIDDSLCELANIVAGQVKRSMKLDQNLGLPKVISVTHEMDKQPWRGATLNSGGRAVNVWVAISDS